MANEQARPDPYTDTSITKRNVVNADVPAVFPEAGIAVRTGNNRTYYAADRLEEHEQHEQHPGVHKPPATPGQDPYASAPPIVIDVESEPDPEVPPEPPGPDSLLTGLQGAYRNGAIDHSGNGNDMSELGPIGTTTGITGIAGAAMSAGDGSICALGKALVSSGPFTFSMFAKFTAQTGGMRQPGIDLDFYGSFVLGAGDILDSYFYVSQLNAVEAEDTNYGGAWHHFVGTYDGTSVGKFYVDGVLVAEEADLSAGFAFDFYIGESTAPASFQNMFVWNRDITAAEVTRLYNGGVGFDPTA